MPVGVRQAIMRIEPYVPGKSATDLTGSDTDDVVKLSSNENPLGPSPEAISAAQGAAEQLHLYPDGASGGLKQALSDFYTVPAEQIVVGCGSDEVIRMLGEAYLEPGEAAVFADVTFSQYAFVTRMMGAEEVVVPLREGVHHLSAMAQAAKEKRAKLVFVCNPNNPTGTYVGLDEVRQFLDELPPETLAVFDEAYIEYTDASDFPDALQFVKEGRRVVTLRTFSKIYALAGLRVGYGIASPEIVSCLERIRPPFNVNRIAQAAAVAALRDESHRQRSFSVNRRERERVHRRLEEMGLSPLPTQSNFIWVTLNRPGTPVYEALLQRGIIVRNGAPFGALDALRITVGTPEENDRFLEALATILSSDV